MKRFLKNQKGQAIFEFILFLPFMLFLYTIYYTSGNSINASINQQKAVRGYYYNLVKGNSYLLTHSDLMELRKSLGPGVQIGFFALGWRDHKGGDDRESFAPCFKFSSLLKNGLTEECDSAERDEGKNGQKSSRFIRVFTAYGVCGPTYIIENDKGGEFYAIEPALQSRAGASCTISDVSR